MNKGTCAEVDYVLARGGSIVPMEVKSGVKGSMRIDFSLTLPVADTFQPWTCQLTLSVQRGS